MSDEAQVVGRWEVRNGTIEQLQRANGELFYRACAKGRCRNAEDLWCAEMYLDQLQGR